jgi:hypothetical protein
MNESRRREYRQVIRDIVETDLTLKKSGIVGLDNGEVLQLWDLINSIETKILSIRS